MQKWQKMGFPSPKCVFYLFNDILKYIFVDSTLIKQDILRYELKPKQAAVLSFKEKRPEVLIKLSFSNLFQTYTLVHLCVDLEENRSKLSERPALT